MFSLSRVTKFTVLSLGALGAGVTYYQTNREDVHECISYRDPWLPTAANTWDDNWDCRDPKFRIKPAIPGDEIDEQRFQDEVARLTGTATNYYILVRHGQYNLAGKTENEKTLTDLGKQQAELVGKRIAKLNFKIDGLMYSPMMRSRQTACIIRKHLPEDVLVLKRPLLVEGMPVLPVTSSGEQKGDVIMKMFQDGPRIEAAFRHIFFRAPVHQMENHHYVIVCHANVIRYFVCRALQLPPVAWSRMVLSHASLTMVVVRPDGRCFLRVFGDVGFMEPSQITIR